MTSIGSRDHLVNILPPTVAANQYSDYFSLGEYARANIIVQTGSVTSACTIVVYESATSGGTSKTAIGFDYFKTSTAASDTFGTRQTATAGGISTGTTNNLQWAIVIDGTELTDGYPYVAVHISTAATQISMAAVLTGSRFGGNPPKSAID